MPAETLTGIHRDAKRWFERLPVHLLEGPKSRKAVEALSHASPLIGEDKLQLPLASEFSPTSDNRDFRKPTSHHAAALFAPRLPDRVQSIFERERGERVSRAWDSFSSRGMD